MQVPGDEMCPETDGRKTLFSAGFLPVLPDNLNNLPDKSTLAADLAPLEPMYLQTVTGALLGAGSALFKSFPRIQADKIPDPDGHGGKAAVNIMGKQEESVFQCFEISLIAVQFKGPVVEKIASCPPGQRAHRAGLKYRFIVHGQFSLLFMVVDLSPDGISLAQRFGCNMPAGEATGRKEVAVPALRKLYEWYFN